VCVLYMENSRLLLEWVEDPCLEKQIHSEFCLFSVNLGDPADLECHDIVLKGIVCFFSSHLFFGGERLHYS